MRSDGTPARVRYTIPSRPLNTSNPLNIGQKQPKDQQSAAHITRDAKLTPFEWGPVNDRHPLGVSHPPAISNVEASVTPATQASRSLSSRGDPTSECGTAQQQPSTTQIRDVAVYCSFGPYVAGSAATHRWSSIGSASTIFIQTTLQSPAEERTPLWEPVFPASTRTTS